MESVESPADLFSKANAAFVAEDYMEAVELYTRAIRMDDTRAEYFVNRAHTLQKLDKYVESKSDAQRAAELNPQDPKAHLRKGIACFHLEQYEEANQAFEQSSTVGGSDAGIRQWLAWTSEKLEKLRKTQSPSKVEVENSSKGEAEKVVTNQMPEPPKAQPIKHDWYQTESHVCVTVLAKNLNPTNVSVDFSRTTMVMKAKLSDDTDYSLLLNLSYPVIPEQSTFTVMKTKVEIKMKKCDGIRWNSLEGDTAAEVKHIPVTSTAAHPPSYPSSAPKRRDWDKIETIIKKEEEEEKPEGEAALNQLFQKIYAEGSDEIRRAMNKSFQESGGTVLSTNWGEVAKEKVTVKPPDGMEFKKWDE